MLNTLPVYDTLPPCYTVSYHTGYTYARNTYIIVKVIYYAHHLHSMYCVVLTPFQRIHDVLCNKYNHKKKNNYVYRYS